MNWKRLLIAIPLGFLIMIADGLLLIAVNRIYLPNHPPHWMTGVIFYIDAWPVQITQYFFPNTGRGPTLAAVLAGAAIDLIIFTAIVYALLSWRARRKARV